MTRIAAALLAEVAKTPARITSIWRSSRSPTAFRIGSSCKKECSRLLGLAAKQQMDEAAARNSAGAVIRASDPLAAAMLQRTGGCSAARAGVAWARGPQRSARSDSRAASA